MQSRHEPRAAPVAQRGTENVLELYELSTPRLELLAQAQVFSSAGLNRGGQLAGLEALFVATFLCRDAVANLSRLQPVARGASLLLELLDGRALVLLLDKRLYALAASRGSFLLFQVSFLQ